MKTARRKTFAKAYEEEINHRRWDNLTHKEQAIVLSFCACVQLLMQGKSMDELLCSAKRKKT